MKYPKPWEAGAPAGPTYVASYRQGEHAGQVQVASYVNRPGTPDHTRLIRTWLSLEQATKLLAELSQHVEMMRRFRGGESVVEGMTNRGEIGTGPYRNPDDREGM